MATQENISAVDGLGFDDLSSVTPNPGVIPGRKLKMLGQTTNNGNVANQQVGTVVLPATTAGTVGTVTVTNSLTSFYSLVFLTAVNENGAGAFQGDATAGRGVDVWVEKVTNGSFIIGYNPRANMSADWSVFFLIVN